MNATLNQILALAPANSFASTFARDVVGRGRPLSPKQEALADRLLAELEAKRDEATVGEIPTGRVTVTGHVRSLRYDEVAVRRYSGWGARGTLKALVAVQDTKPYKLWVTVPSAASNVQVGDILIVTVEVLPKDNGFAIGKRPTLVSHVTVTQPENA